MTEKYEPDPEEIQRAEDFVADMTDEQKQANKMREDNAIHVEPLAKIEFPFDIWLKGSVDAWIIKMIKERIADHGYNPFDQAAALGMYMRMEEIS